jgi:transposase
VLLCPEHLADDIAEATPVRVLDAVVAALDLAACGFPRAVPAATGRPGDAPGARLKRSLSGDLSRLRASRRLEQEAQRNVALLWLLKKLRPDHKTSANFRKNTRAPLRQVCRTCTRLCQQLALCGAERVAMDGSKFRAVHAKERNCTQDKLTKRLAHLDEPMATDLKERERNDTEEEGGTGGGAHAEALAATIEARKQRTLR